MSRISDLRSWIVTASGSLDFPPGVGIPGSVMASGDPLWAADVKELANFPRCQAAAACGIGAGYSPSWRMTSQPRGTVSRCGDRGRESLFRLCHRGGGGYLATG